MLWAFVRMRQFSLFTPSFGIFINRTYDLWQYISRKTNVSLSLCEYSLAR